MDAVADTRSHVLLALRAIAACRPDAKAALLVAQHDRQAVDLGLNRKVTYLAAEQTSDALVPGAQRVGRERIRQAEHRHPMLNHGKLCRRPRADALRRRIG